MGAAALPILQAVVVAVGLPLSVLALAHPSVAVVLLAFSIPFSSWTKIAVGAFTVTSTDVLVALLALGWIGRGILRGSLVVHSGPIVVALLVFFGTAVLSSLTAVEFPDAAKELIKLAEMITVALYAASVLREPAGVRLALFALLAAGATEALNGLRQFVLRSGPDFFALGPFMRAYGDFGQPNALAGYLGMILPFGLVLAAQPGRGRTFAALATVVVGAGIAATWSRGAWLGIALALALMALVWSERTRRGLALGTATVGFVIVLGLGGLLPATLTERLTVVFENFVVFDVTKVEPTPENWSLVERMAHWQAGWEMALDYPVTGVGPGNYEAVYDRYAKPGWLEALGHAHNYYINTFAELGIIGLVALAGLILTMFTRIVCGLRRAGADQPLERTVLVGTLGAAVALCVHNTFDNMFVHGIAVQFGLILGLADAAAQRICARDGA